MTPFFSTFGGSCNGGVGTDPSAFDGSPRDDVFVARSAALVVFAGASVVLTSRLGRRISRAAAVSASCRSFAFLRTCPNNSYRPGGRNVATCLIASRTVAAPGARRLAAAKPLATHSRIAFSDNGRSCNSAETAPFRRANSPPSSLIALAATNLVHRSTSRFTSSLAAAALVVGSGASRASTITTCRSRFSRSSSSPRIFTRLAVPSSNDRFGRNFSDTAPTARRDPPSRAPSGRAVPRATIASPSSAMDANARARPSHASVHARVLPSSPTSTRAVRRAASSSPPSRDVDAARAAAAIQASMCAREHRTRATKGGADPSRGSTGSRSIVRDMSRDARRRAARRDDEDSRAETRGDSTAGRGGGVSYEYTVCGWGTW